MVSKFEIVLKKARESYIGVSQKFGACMHAPSRSQGQAMLFVLGMGMLFAGLTQESSALTTTYNDTRVSNSVNMILTYMEGSFGALVMVGAGITAILSAAFGQYRAALGALVVAVGAFILRSFMSTFFNDTKIQA